jgi:uncharacterized membrane protein YkgB
MHMIIESPSLMSDPLKRFDSIDSQIAGWMERYGLRILRYSLAIIFIWFGLLKPLGISPAAELVKRTVYWLPQDSFIHVLGYWEALIGVLLLFRPGIRVAILLLFLQMPGTMLPLIILPEICYTEFPYGLTLEGQYIVKNLVLIGAGLVVGGTVRYREVQGKML